MKEATQEWIGEQCINIKKEMTTRSSIKTLSTRQQKTSVIKDANLHFFLKENAAYLNV
ncbi:hypothetical protein DPMN_164264 [Dreissena polymorpha]|uniref:Uncharacterized protein n=1 Tax=Dreissena polymorpha TaxID=45954 RepID=A0A9D4EXE5_DREPO|nr:hypothetical protein DPMN_164264 [Dreissena polymorpha]